MKCPVCDVDLSISSREGVEIDFCPQCRGVWLDRGELDKIIDRVAVATASPGFDDRRPEPAREPGRDDRSYGENDRYDDRSERGNKKRKRRNFLEDLFEFD